MNKVDMKDANELRRIRNKFRALRPQFAELFLGVSINTLVRYETGINKIPESVMMLARSWEKILDDMRAGK